MSQYPVLQTQVRLITVSSFPSCGHGHPPTIERPEIGGIFLQCTSINACIKS